MKKLLALFLSLALVLTATAGLAEALKIGIVIPDGDHGFTGESIKHAQSEIDAQVAALGAENLEYRLLTGDATKQIADIETLLGTWDPDVVMLWPNEGEQLRNSAQAIVDKGIKLVIYDRLITDFQGMAAEIMGDNVTIGKMMGNYILKTFDERLKAGEKLQYLLFIGDSSTVPQQRTDGMMESINASPYKDQFELVLEPVLTNWSNQIAMEKMEAWLSTADDAVVADLDFIATHDDEIVDGLTMALDNSPKKAAGLKLITSVGARRETLDTYEGRDVALCTYYFSPSFIREAIRLAIAVGKGEQYQAQDVAGQQFLIPTVEVDKDTVAAFRQSDVFVERYSVN